MSSKAVILFVSILLPAISHADSSINFLSPTKAQIFLNNGASADANFFWNILSVEPIARGNKQTKSYLAARGDFKALCHRVSGSSGAVTTCTLLLTETGAGSVVKASQAENKVTGLFPYELSEAFRMFTQIVKSPDQTLTVCSVCGVSGAGLPFSISWNKK